MNKLKSPNYLLEALVGQAKYHPVLLMNDGDLIPVEMASAPSSITLPLIGKAEVIFNHLKRNITVCVKAGEGKGAVGTRIVAAYSGGSVKDMQEAYSLASALVDRLHRDIAEAYAQCILAGPRR